MDDTPADGEEWLCKDAVGLEEVERVSFKRRFWHLQKLCRDKHRKVPDTVAESVAVAEAVESAEEFGKQLSE